jgi:dihydrolipoamide dehydrogenase
MYDYDLISVGAGSGGCASAMRAADLGLRAALVEARDKGTGGTCVNRGCIPTKVLVKSAQVLNEVKGAAQYGVRAENAGLDMNAVAAEKEPDRGNLRFGLDNFLIKPRRSTGCRKGQVCRCAIPWKLPGERPEPGR